MTIFKFLKLPAIFKKPAFLTGGRAQWIWTPFKRLLILLKLRQDVNRDQRVLERYRCQINGMLISGRLAHVPGRLKDISAGGCLFRPSSFYLVDRIGEEVGLYFGEVELQGKIVRTLPIGYAVQFESLLTDEVLKAVLAQSAIEASIFNKSQEDETRETEAKAKTAA